MYFWFLHCIMDVVIYSVSQEYTAFSFRVTDLVQVDVEGMGGKKMCQLYRAVWGSLFRVSELTEISSQRMNNNWHEDVETQVSNLPKLLNLSKF